MKKWVYVLIFALTAVFSLTVSAEGESGPCATHTWDSGVIKWNEDYTAAVGVWTCTGCGETHSEQADVSSTRTEGTCQAVGEVQAMATAMFVNMSVYDWVKIELPLLEHEYAYPEFQWNTVDFDCMAYWKCIVGGETDFNKCTVTKSDYSSDGHVPGGTIYVATIEVGGVTYADTRKVEGSPIDHDYCAPVFYWSEDYKTAYFESICSLCKIDDLERIRGDKCTVREYIYEATCSSDGYAEYTASAELLDKTWKETKTVVIPKIEHAYTVPVFTWDEDGNSCQANYECTVGGETHNEPCTIIEEKIYTDCVSPGVLKKTAIVTIAGEDIKNPKDIEIEIPATNHKYSICIPGKAATCSEAGVADGYQCADCGEINEGAVLEKLDHIEASTRGSAPTCTEPGLTEKRYCKICNEVFQDATVIPATGHTSKTVPGYDPSCTDEGCGEGEICSVCGEELKVQNVIPALGHTPLKLDSRDATCTEDGYTAGEICEVCNTVLKKQTILPATGKHVPLVLDSHDATCTEEGFSAKTICSVCKTTLEESDVIEPKGHRFGTAVFSWSADGRSATAEKTCDVCRMTEQGEISAEEETVAENGVDYMQITVTATFSDGTKETDRNRVELPEEEVPTDKDDSTEDPESPQPDAPPVTPSPDVPEPIIPVQPQAPAEEPTPSDKDAAQDIPSFDDVPIDSYYYDAVMWAAKEKITQGTADRIFSPDMVCSRAQIVTMLWRAVGSPVALNKTIPFTDVSTKAYYYDAVVWASEFGITSGTSKTTFSPDLQCSRAQIVTMLWRAAGCPKAGVVKSFSDVAKDAWYADAVAWAVQQGITLGTGEGIFSPGMVCTRAQIVTFMYRARQFYS